MHSYEYFTQYINLLADYYDGEQDISDFVHEQADGSEYVIYYGKAWDLVSLIKDADSSLLYDAEDCVTDTGYTFDNLNDLMSVHAYWIIKNSLETLMHDKYTEKLNNV